MEEEESTGKDHRVELSGAVGASHCHLYSIGVQGGGVSELEELRCTSMLSYINAVGTEIGRNQHQRVARPGWSGYWAFIHIGNCMSPLESLAATNICLSLLSRTLFISLAEGRQGWLARLAATRCPHSLALSLSLSLALTRL